MSSSYIIPRKYKNMIYNGINKRNRNNMIHSDDNNSNNNIIIKLNYISTKNMKKNCIIIINTINFMI